MSTDKVIVTKILLVWSAFTIVGILASGFDTEQFDPQPDVWVPFQLDARRVFDVINAALNNALDASKELKVK